VEDLHNQPFKPNQLTFNLLDEIMKRNSQKVPIGRTIENASVLRGNFLLAFPPTVQFFCISCRAVLLPVCGKPFQASLQGPGSAWNSHPGTYPVFLLTKKWKEHFRLSWQHSSLPKPEIEKRAFEENALWRMKMSTEGQDRMRRGTGNEKYPNRRG
jgi:hypothetical protein